MSPDQLDEIARYVADWYPAPARVDWEDALYRVEAAFNLDLGSDMLSADIQAIKKAARAERRGRSE